MAHIPEDGIIRQEFSLNVPIRQVQLAKARAASLDTRRPPSTVTIR
jgi:hypothetical protein